MPHDTVPDDVFLSALMGNMTRVIYEIMLHLYGDPLPHDLQYAIDVLRDALGNTRH